RQPRPRAPGVREEGDRALQVPAGRGVRERSAAHRDRQAPALQAPAGFQGLRIVVVGGGPAGLYFSILVKKLDPRHEVTILERNRAGDTFGWGVVFSDETLSNFAEADAESHAQILKAFAYWTDIDIFYKGGRVRSTGHGFCGVSRRKFLNILQERASSLGVRLVYEAEVDRSDQWRDTRPVLPACGANRPIPRPSAPPLPPPRDSPPPTCHPLRT